MGSGSEIKAGRAYVEVTTKNSPLYKGLRAAQQRLSGFGSAVTAAGAKLLAAGTAAVAPFLASAKAFADAGSELVDMSQRTGLSVEALSELSFAAKQSGADLESLETAVKKMQNSLVDAAAGKGPAVDALAALGLSVEALMAMQPDQQLTAIGDALSKIQDPAQRTALAMDIFGKSGTKLLPMFAGGAAGMEAMRQRARELGLTWSTEAAEGAEKFGDQMETAWMVVQKIGIEIAAALLPTLTQFTTVITGVAASVIDWVRHNEELVQTLFKWGVGAATAGAALVALGTTVSLVAKGIGAAITTLNLASAAISGISAVAAFLVTPVGLVTAAVVALGLAFLYATGLGGKAFAYFESKLKGLQDSLTPQTPGRGGGQDSAPSRQSIIGKKPPGAPGSPNDAETQRKLDEAQRKLDEALAAAEKSASGSLSAHKPGGHPGDAPRPRPPANPLRPDEARTEIAGTFNAASLAGLGTGVQDRIAKATERTAVNTEKALKNKNGQPKFG